MPFINTDNSDYPLYLVDLEELGWVQGQPLPSNISEVILAEVPLLPLEQTLREIAPVQDEHGLWHQTYEVIPRSQEEIDSITLTEIRDKIYHRVPITQSELDFLNANVLMVEE